MAFSVKIYRIAEGSFHIHYPVLSMLITGLNKHIPTEIIAHRGASYIAPENTLASVRQAWKLNADTVEIDVNLTQDKRIVAIHDLTTKRTTSANFVVNKTSSEELRKLDAGILKSKKFAGQKIPFLEEVISTTPHDRRLLIEIKCGKEIIPGLQKIIKENGKLYQIALTGFDLKTVSAAKKLMPEISTYWLCNTVRNKLTRKPLPYDRDLITIMKENNLDGLSLHYDGITEEFAETVLYSGLKLYAWTINDLEDAVRLLKYRVHGIITDRPGWILNNLNK